MLAESIEEVFTQGRIIPETLFDLAHIQPRGCSSFEPTKAMVDVINGLTPEDIDKWELLCKLIDGAKFYNDDIKNALRRRFVSFGPYATSSRASVLVTLLNLGCRFHPVDLNKESDIREELPWVWRTAWERSGILAYMPNS